MKGNKLWNGRYIFLMIINFCTAFSFYMIVSLLSVYLTDIGVSLSAAGVIIGLFSITSLVMRPLAGFLTDSFSKKWLIILATGMTVIGTFGYFLTDRVTVIIVLRIMHGIGFGVNSTAVISLASQYIPEERLGEGVGYFGLGQVLSGAVGPAAGVFIMDFLGLRSTFVTAGCISILAIVLTFTFPEGEKGKRERARFRFSVRGMIAPEVLHFALISGLFSFINGIVSSYLLLFGDSRGIANISLYFTVYALCMFIIRPYSGRLMDQRGLRSVAYPALTLTAAGMLLLGFSRSLPAVLTAGILRALGQGALQPSLQAASIKKVERERVGTANSTYYLGGDIGQGIGPAVGGAVISQLGYTQLFGMCACCMLLGMVIFRCTEKEAG